MKTVPIQRRSSAVWLIVAALTGWPLIATAQPAASPSPSILPHDLSPMGMFMAADIVVKSVMLGLLAASVLTWTVFLVKLAELWWARRRVSHAADRIAGASGLDDASRRLGDGSGVVSQMLRAAMDEKDRTGRGSDPAGVRERVSSLLSDLVTQTGRRMATGTGLLATIGSTAPFVGLFGTVWGIMNSFIGISQAQTTNLAVVAPGIAEALLATALGLVAAIPAVVIYNLFARAITTYRVRLGMVASAIQRHLSRDMDLQQAQGET